MQSVVFLFLEREFLPGHKKLLSEQDLHFVDFIKRHPARLILMGGLVDSLGISEGLSDSQRLIADLKLVGSTPCLPDGTPYLRYAEIMSWIKRRGDFNGTWVALSHYLDLFPADCQNLIPCDIAEGITAEKLLLLKEKMSN